MGTMWKATLTFFSLASFISTQAQNLSEASVVLLNEDQTPRCQLTDNAPVEGLRQCDEGDITYAQRRASDSVELAGAGGKNLGRALMGIFALGLAGFNAGTICIDAANRDENNPRERTQGPGRTFARGLGAATVHTLLGLLVMGKQQLVASALWGLGIQLPASYGAWNWCNKGLDRLIDYAEEHGEPIE